MLLKSWCQSRNEDNEDSLNATTTFLGSSCMKGFFILAAFFNIVFTVAGNVTRNSEAPFFPYPFSTFTIRMQPLFIVFLLKMSFSIWVFLKKPFYPRTCKCSILWCALRRRFWNIIQEKTSLEGMIHFRVKLS